MNGPNLAKMAWRNLWRHRRRTLITLSSIAFGTMLAILFTGLGDSNFGGMIDLAARLGGGHVTLQHDEYLDTPTLGRSVEDIIALSELALRDPDVERVVTRISGQMMLASAAQNQGAAFIAFDPAAEDADTLSVIEAIDEGQPFGAGDAEGIILGRRLAENLKAPLGRKVVFTVTDRHGDIIQEATRVRAIVSTGAPSVDAGLALLPLRALQRSVGYAGDEAGQVAVFLRDQRKAGAVAERLSASLGSGVSALPWYEIQPDLAGFIGMKVAGTRFMEIIIMLLIAAGIFNTLFVSVMERMREFGILMAIGFTPKHLFGLVMFESLWLGLSGLVLAGLLVAYPYHYLHSVGIDIADQIDMSGSEIAGVAVSTVMRVAIYPENLALILAVALGATLLSGLYPAWKAGTVAPVESIRLV
ncbi:MAG: hypothetical protein CL910_22135 [Deltaproteobacteria bacterium]|jgi:ABC-type lipoprotein release transport system permease subunit|nr:hypothetical protein [Deltaproteobacteria bacterium]